MADELVIINTRITLKDAVQRRLAADLESDAGLQARLDADPDAVIKPIIAELLGDDGGIDLSNVTTSVHVEDDTNLHFVVTPGATHADHDDLDEVSGFSMTGMSDMLGMTIDLDAKKPPADARTRDPGCPPLEGPLVTMNRKCNTSKKKCQL